MSEEDMKFAVIVDGSANLVHAVSSIDAIEKTLAEYKKRDIGVREITAYLLSVEIK